MFCGEIGGVRGKDSECACEEESECERASEPTDGKGLKGERVVLTIKTMTTLLEERDTQAKGTGYSRRSISLLKNVYIS